MTKYGPAISALVLSSIPSSALADTHHLATDGTDGGDCVASPCLSLQYAFAQMSAGDTLQIAPGTYTGEENRITTANVPPAGLSTSEPTLIAAADGPGTVIFDGENTRNMFHFEGGAGGRTDLQYTRWQGLLWVKNGSDYGGYGLYLANGGSADMTSTDLTTPALHVYFKNCGFHGEGNSVQLMYVVQALFEDCWTWGNGRYGYNISRSDYVVVRRNVDRRDNLNAGGSRPSASYINYWSHYVELQNCISLDIDNELWSREGSASYHDPYGGFYIRTSAGSTPRRYSENTAIRGGIVLNYAADYPSANDSRIAGIYLQDDTIGSVIENTVVWGCSKGIYVNDADSDVQVDHCTVGAAARETGGTWQYAFGDRAGSGRFNVENSVAVANSFLVGLYQASSSSDYNNLYGNSNDESSGAHDTYVDPQIAYIPRIETDSPNFNTGSTGHKGATILHKYGVDGTFYGEAGFDLLTAEGLWPWPNQDVIRTSFRNDYGATDETRGFCAADQSLTRYIWEYAGNEMPSDISDGGSGGGGGTPPGDGGSGEGGSSSPGAGGASEGDSQADGCSGCSGAGAPGAGAWSLMLLCLLRLRRERGNTPECC